MLLDSCQTILAIAFHLCSQTHPPVQDPSGFTTTSAVLKDYNCFYDHIIKLCHWAPAVRVARWSLIGVGERVAAHHLGEAERVGQSVSHRHLIVYRCLVSYGVICNIQKGSISWSRMFLLSDITLDVVNLWRNSWFVIKLTQVPAAALAVVIVHKNVGAIVCHTVLRIAQKA